MLTVIDTFTRECLAIDVYRSLTSGDLLERLSDLFVRRGVPRHIRGENRPEFTARSVKQWLSRVGVTTLYLKAGTPWQNGCFESFNGKLRVEVLDGEIFHTSHEAKILIERLREDHETERLLSSLGYRALAPVPIVPGAREAMVEAFERLS